MKRSVRAAKSLRALIPVLLVLAAGTVRADLIAHYTFDDGEPFDEESGFDGIAEGDATAAGEGSGVDGTGQSFRFSGAGHIRVPIDINPTALPELTVTMWVKADPTLPDSPGLYKTFGHDDGGWDRVFGLDNRNAEYRWCSFTGTGPGPATGTPVTSDWTFLAAVWGDVDDDGLPIVRFHAGENFVEAPFTETFSSFTDVAIGSLRPDNFNEGFRGRIDEVMFFDEILSPEDLDEIRNSVTIPEDLPPEVLTLAPTNARPGTVTLRGSVNPNGARTTVRFEYGDTTAYGSTTPDFDAGDTFAGQVVSAPLTGLADFQVVHYRIVGESPNGTSQGADQVIVVPSATEPLAHFTFDGGDATDDTGHGFDGTPEGDALATLDGLGIGDEGQAFEFLGAGHVVVPLNVNPAVYPDLTVTMWVKANEFLPASPGLYKTFGHDDGGWDRTFGLDNRSGPFRWAAFDGGAGTGTTPDTGTEVTSDWTFLAAVWSTAQDGTAEIRFHANANTIEQEILNTTSVFTTFAIGNLRPDNFAEGFQGLIDEVRVYGAPLSIEEVDQIRGEFAPLEPGVPRVETFAASGVNPGGATLEGRVVPNGAETTAYFEYGTTTAYGQKTPDVIAGEGFASIPLDSVLTGLDLETGYHFRLVAENSFGKVEGEDMFFFVPNADFLLLHYTFDDEEAEDVSGNEHHGVPEGDAFPTGPGVDDSDADFEFFGAGHIVVPIDINPAVLPDLTVTMWVKASELLPAIPGLYKTFGHDDGGWDRTFGLDNREGEFRWAAFTGGAGTGITADTGTPVTSEWTFLAGVWDTGEDGTATIRFHANDLFVEEDLINTASVFTTCAIGNLRPDNFAEGWQGQIDEVRMYGRALSVDEIDAIRTGEEPPPVGNRFVRGNADGVGPINITDGVFVLNYLFTGGGDPPCKDAADADDSGVINITDGVYILNFLFTGGADPRPPWPDCGVDPSGDDDGVDCAQSDPSCAR